jgi:hypothetical protein
MSATAVDYRKIIQIVAPLIAALVAVSAGRVPAQAQSNLMLIIPASDGYGFDDCISSHKSCGQIIADAWCEAHGMAASTAFGRAEDVTASIPARAPASKSGPMAATATKFEPGAFVVNCRD